MRKLYYSCDIYYVSYELKPKPTPAGHVCIFSSIIILIWCYVCG